MFNSLDLLLHENLSRTSPKPISSTTPCSSRTTERRTKCAEYSTIQKDSVHCIVGADNISDLLSSIWCSNSCSVYLWPSRRLRMASRSNSYYVKLDPKSISVLLEDKGNETSSDGHDRTALLFLELTACVVDNTTISIHSFVNQPTQK